MAKIIKMEMAKAHGDTVNNAVSEFTKTLEGYLKAGWQPYGSMEVVYHRTRDSIDIIQEVVQYDDDIYDNDY